MTKIKARQYKEREFLDTKEVQEEIINLLAYNSCDTYQEELNYVLGSFQNLIFSAHVLGGYDDFYKVYHDAIESTIKNIKTCVSYYLKGQIYKSFGSFYYGWNKLWDEASSGTKVLTMDKDTIFYKLRKKEHKPFKKKDFFHVPFHQRGKIGNNRFSISGYPCLYLGKSIYTCWEETRRPNLSEISASAFRVEKPIRLLDLRLKTMIKSPKDEDDYWLLLPYILASCIRVHEEDAVFKPEYIIPQLLLHSVVKSRKQYGYDGVIFTSTRRRMFLEENRLDLYENVAIPVMSNRGNSYCKMLASYFSETEPIYFEHEFLKGSVANNSTEKGKYEKSTFYALEQILKNKEFGAIL